MVNKALKIFFYVFLFKNSIFMDIGHRDNVTFLVIIEEKNHYLFCPPKEVHVHITGHFVCVCIYN